MSWFNSFVEGLFFQVDRSKYWRPEHFGLTSEEKMLSAPKGSIYTVFLPAYVDNKFSSQKAKATILYAHPCRRNLNFHLSQISWLCASGFNVLTYDPIGCGRSEGNSISLDSVNDDALSVYKDLKKRKDIDKNRIFLFGQDVGAAALLNLSAHHPIGIRGLIIDSIWATNNGLLLNRYGPGLGHLCAHLMPKRVDPIDNLKAITIPLALVVCGKNNLVPDKEMQLVMRGAPEQREIWFEPSCQHMQCFAQPTICRDYFIEFIMKTLKEDSQITQSEL